MSGAQEPVGTLDVALAHAARMLVSDPALAAELAADAERFFLRTEARRRGFTRPAASRNVAGKSQPRGWGGRDRRDK